MAQLGIQAMKNLALTCTGNDMASGNAISVKAKQTDLLLRLFESQFFDEWMALTYVDT